MPYKHRRGMSHLGGAGVVGVKTSIDWESVFREVGISSLRSNRMDRFWVDEVA